MPGLEWSPACVETTALPGMLSADQISGPLRSILNHQKNADVLMDEVTGINTNERTAQLRQRHLSYDFLDRA
jgi:NADH dehydrogenase